MTYSYATKSWVLEHMNRCLFGRETLAKAAWVEPRTISSWYRQERYGATKSRACVRSVPHLSEFEPFAKHQNHIDDALKPYGVNVHSLRKTYAYILKSAGVHVTTASKLLGHADPALTLRVYTLVRDDETELAGIAVTQFIGRSFTVPNLEKSLTKLLQ